MSQFIQFPKNFSFGIGDADLQVIGEKFTREEEQSTPTMWTHFAKNSGKCHQNETPEQGIDRYHHFPEDIKIINNLGIKDYRTSISMSRIVREDGNLNTKAIEWYRNYFIQLRANGTKIYATLYHWELPQFLQDKGGWTNRITIDRFLKHTKYVVQNLDDLIDEYLIINEPWCIAMKGYVLGGHAPGDTSLKNGLAANHNILLAIGLAFEEIKRLSPNKKIGTVFNSESYYAASESKEDQLAQSYGDGFFNRWFTDPLFKGKYPEDMSELYGKNLPSIENGDMDIIKVGNRMDTFGQNFYCGNVVKYDPNSPFKFKSANNPNGPTNGLGWPITVPPYYPEGFFDMISKIYNSYKDYGLKEIYITENGMALKSPWDGKSEIINDDNRIAYFSEHLRQLHKATESGIPVTKYFAWTLMDNYEWEEGYRPDSCFGLIHVDRKTMKRVWKKSAHWYKEVIKNHGFEI